jgi:hypothetical protein
MVIDPKGYLFCRFAPYYICHSHKADKLEGELVELRFSCKIFVIIIKKFLEKPVNLFFTFQ